MIDDILYPNLQGENIIPDEFMIKHKLSTKMILKGPQKPEEFTSLQDCVNDISSQSYAHILEARRLHSLQREKEGKTTANNNMNVFYPAVGAVHYLETLQKNDFDPFFAVNNSPSYYTLQLQMKLYKGKFMKKF